MPGVRRRRSRTGSGPTGRDARVRRADDLHAAKGDGLSGFVWCHGLARALVNEESDAGCSEGRPKYPASSAFESDPTVDLPCPEPCDSFIGCVQNDCHTSVSTFIRSSRDTARKIGAASPIQLFALGS
jgi:hypothetical protein